MVDPRQAKIIEKTYSETLSRTYSAPSGYRIMQSIADGAEQSRATPVHKPEVCYPAQGVQLLNTAETTLASPLGPIRVTPVDTKLRPRRKPVTDWITVGDRIVQGNLQKNIERTS